MKIIIGTRIVIDIDDTAHETRVFIDDQPVNYIANLMIGADARDQVTHRLVEFVSMANEKPEAWVMDVMRDAGFTVTVTVLDANQCLETARVHSTT